jgi:hypothetical protein
MSHNNDYIERWRRFWYPKFHKALSIVGLYATAGVDERQYAFTLSIDEERAEEIFLHELGFERNPLSAYKTHVDGRESELSLRLVNTPEYVEDGMQLHLTLFERKDGKPGRDVYAHYEDDWEHAPIDHVRSKHMSLSEGVARSRAVLKQQTSMLHNGDAEIQDR